MFNIQIGKHIVVNKIQKTQYLIIATNNKTTLELKDFEHQYLGIRAAHHTASKAKTAELSLYPQ